MEAVTPKELIPYLKTAVELESSIYKQESSIYKQESAIKAAEYSLETNRPSKRMPNKPIKKKETEPHLLDTGSAILEYLVGAVGAFLCWLSYNGYSDNKNDKISFVFMLFGGALFLICAIKILSYISVDSNNKKIYKKELEAYNAATERNQTEYNLALEKYQAECVQAEEDYQHHLLLFNDAQNAIEQLKLPLHEARETLEKLYEIDWIFPKYQNFIAVCSIYEYFLTGRCSELVGPSGAYNLYESELRQNLIISNLESILNELNTIKNNQYVLYKELERAQQSIGHITSEIEGIYSETIKISDASYISAMCAEATKQSAEAIRYITLINAAH